MSSAKAYEVRHGQHVGARRVGVPERFTRGPGMEMKRVRNERATAGRPSTSTSWMSPRIRVQRTRLCASTVHRSHAPLAQKFPDGQCSSPAPSFRSRMS